MAKLTILRSTAMRLAIGYALLFVLSSFLLMGFFWWRTAAYLEREVNAVILADAQAIGDRLQDFGLSGAVETINQRVRQHADEHAIYLLADPGLAPVAGNLAAWPLRIGPQTGWYQVELARDDKLYAARILYVGLPKGFHLLVGRDVQDMVAIRHSIVDDLGSVVLVAVILAMIGGLLVRRAILHRVDAINRTASGIVLGDLSKRVPTRGSSDEFDQLSQTINGMLQQIEVLVDGVRNATNAVAHDLRTPLTELRGRLEEVLRAPPPPETILREVQAAVSDLDHLIEVFNALLRLAEIDSGARLSGFRDVPLDKIAAEVADLYGPLAEENQITLITEIPSGLIAKGDPFLLAQAIGNLLDNALKYAPPSGRVTLSLAHHGDDEICIRVADNGPGIPKDELPKVTERFFRGRASHETDGLGLGLSLVAAVARLHGGQLDLIEMKPGLLATLSLPSIR
jgi:signal transduction histidine kinase